MPVKGEKREREREGVFLALGIETSTGEESVYLHRWRGERERETREGQLLLYEFLHRHLVSHTYKQTQIQK